MKTRLKDAIDAGQMSMFSNPPSQHSLPRQLNLPRRLSLFPTSFTDTYRTSVSQLDFIFDSREWTRAMMREVNAGEGAGAEVIRTTGCD